MDSTVARRVGVCLVALVLLTSLVAGVAVAQDGDETGESGEAGELIEAEGWGAVGFLLLGTIVLMASIKLLIHALVRTAIRFGVSTFLLAVIFSGWEFDNVAFGLFTGFREMQNVAFGLAIGNAVSIFGLTLALGALLFPFVTDVPNDYLGILVGSPFLLVPVILSGTLTLPLSVMFLFLYVVIFAYIVQQERHADRRFMRSEEVTEAATVADGNGAVERRVPEPLAALTRRDWFWPLLLVVAVGGIVVGAEGSATGVEGIMETWELTGTVVGVTLITLLYTLDDLLLIAEPLRLGYDDIAVGGVVGSLLFFVTANVGIVGLVGEIEFQPQTVLFHLPALLVFAALSTFLLWRGRLSRRHGAALLGLYAGYLAITVWLFATVPVPE
jgi:cation:H+ antiporter